MKVEVILSDGRKISEGEDAGWWRREVMNSGLKIKELLLDNEPFQPNADGYFMLFQCLSLVTGGRQFHSKGVGYVMERTGRARMIWLHPGNQKQAEVMKPIPDFIREIMVEREKTC